MTKEYQKFEMEQCEMFFGGGNKNAGQLVETKKGLAGRTYNHEEPINGKIIVHVGKAKLLCDPKTVKLKGFID